MSQPAMSWVALASRAPRVRACLTTVHCVEPKAAHWPRFETAGRLGSGCVVAVPVVGFIS